MRTLAAVTRGNELLVHEEVKVKHVQDGCFVACSSKKDIMGDRIEIGQQYTGERFQYLCHFNGTERLLIYEPISKLDANS